MLKKTLILTALVALTLPALAGASPQDDRNKAFKQIARTNTQIGKIVKGDVAYDKAGFATLVASLKQASPEPFKLFPAGSQQGSRAKPEIWSKPADFKAATDKYLNAVNALDAAAQSGDLATIRTAYGAVGQSCKACHDSFRGKEN